MSIESMMPFNHLILCQPLFLIPSVFQVLRTIYLSSLDTLLLQYLKSQKMCCLMMDLCYKEIIELAGMEKIKCLRF